MAFKYANPQPGDIRTLRHDLSCVNGTLLAGSRVKILGSTHRGWELEDLESGEQVGETIWFDIFEKE